MFNMNFNTGGMTNKEIAKMILSYLGIKARPINVSFLNNLFDHMHSVSPLHYQISSMQSENDDLRQDLSLAEDIEIGLRSDLNKLQRELFALKLANNPINWEKLCQDHPNSQVEMIKEVRESHNLGFTEARDLVFAHTAKKPNIGKGFNEVSLNPESYIWTPVVQEKSREIKVEVKEEAKTV